MRRRKVKEEGEHETTVTVTIAKASLTDSDHTDDRHDKKSVHKAHETPKAQNYFHCSYKLLPDDKESTKTDVVTFGIAAKLYTESDSRVLRTWTEGNKTWVAWTNSHKIKVTKDLLLKMFNHTLELKIWDTKDKVSAKARFDRPKTFRLPTSRGGDERDIEKIKKLLLKNGLTQKEASRVSTAITPETGRKLPTAPPDNSKPKKVTITETNRARTAPDVPSVPSTASKPHRSPEILNMPSSTSIGGMQVKVRLNKDNQPEFGKLLSLASSGIKHADVDSGEEADDKSSRDETGKTSVADGSRKKSTTTGLAKGSRKKIATPSTAQRKAEIQAAYIRLHGLAIVPIKLSSLFTGTTFVDGRLESPAGTVEDLIITLTLDSPLLSEPQKKVLNPMVIKVSSANNMPKKPLGYDQLRVRCLPPYISYKFHNQSVHYSHGGHHGKKIVFNDVYVVLLGTLDSSLLFEYLRGPPFAIELHDRDRNIILKKGKASVFGEKEDDAMISHVSLITSRRTLHNPFKGKDTPWDPYGVAKFDLSELLLGEKILELSASVQSCKSPDVIDGRGRQHSHHAHEKIVGKPGSVDGPGKSQNEWILETTYPLMVAMLGVASGRVVRSFEIQVAKETNGQKNGSAEEKDVPLPAANYLEAGCELKIKIELAYPLRTPDDIQDKKLTASPKKCPFTRLVYIFDYQNSKFLRQLQSTVTIINACALELTEFPLHVIEAALSTYKLTDLQRSSNTLNILTGFQIIDGRYHIFVLEGLRDQGVRQLWEALPHPQVTDDETFRALYNSEMTFHTRLYASLDVDLTRIRLHQPLSNIVQLPLLYVRDMVPSPCFDAVTKLHEISQCTRLRHAVRNDLFPSAEMIASLSKEFGIPLTTDDLIELESDSKSEDKTEFESGDNPKGSSSKVKFHKTSRPWTPLEIFNEKYEEELKERETKPKVKDYIEENVNRVRRLEPIKRERTVTMDLSELHHSHPHNYSIQNLNSTEKAKQRLREILSQLGFVSDLVLSHVGTPGTGDPPESNNENILKRYFQRYKKKRQADCYCLTSVRPVQEPDSRFTYSQRYNTATVLPIDLDTAQRDQMKSSQSQWRTSSGFVFPGPKTSAESNENPKRPDFARLDELKKPWRENVLHANVLRPTVDRMTFSWDERKQDFSTWSRPPIDFGISPPVTIHLAGDRLKEEKREAEHKDKTLWKDKLVVDDPRLKVHRCTAETELKSKGFKSSSQLARLEDILKDPPRKHALSAPGLTLEKIPALSVVLNPRVDPSGNTYDILKRAANDYEARERNRGFQPGPFEKDGWLLERNKIPIHDYRHKQFEEIKGNDFSLYHKERDVLSRRSIKPLTLDEKDNYVFSNGMIETKGS